MWTNVFFHIPLFHFVFIIYDGTSRYDFIELGRQILYQGEVLYFAHIGLWCSMEEGDIVYARAMKWWRRWRRQRRRRRVRKLHEIFIARECVSSCKQHPCHATPIPTGVGGREMQKQSSFLPMILRRRRRSQRWEIHLWDILCLQIGLFYSWVSIDLLNQNKLRHWPTRRRYWKNDICSVRKSSSLRWIWVDSLIKSVLQQHHLFLSP